MAGKQKEITTRQVASIQFGMYTDEEVGDPLPPRQQQQHGGSSHRESLCCVL